eukprot:s7717_g1.t1
MPSPCNLPPHSHCEQARHLQLGFQETCRWSLSVAVVLRWCLQPKIERFRAVPGAWLSGVLPQFGPGGRDITKKLGEFSANYGEEGVFEMNVGRTRTIVCCSWEAISVVLALRPFRAINSGSITDLTEGLFHGIMFSEGDDWKRERRSLL